MKVLFDCRWDKSLAPPDVSEKDVESFLDMETTAIRIDRAVERTVVWAKVVDLDAPKLLVRDVRILRESDEIKPGLWSVSDRLQVLLLEGCRLQVLLLEGWRTVERVWTDEESVETIEGVQ